MSDETHEPLNIVAIFFREGGWYSLDLPEDTDWAKHAELNPGTLKIENLDGDILWRLQ